MATTNGESSNLLVLVPGAWMGGWIWKDTIRRLADLGIEATTLTLVGLEPELPLDEVADVRLEDHVAQLVDFVRELSDVPVVLVGHSYSGIVIGQVADRVPEKVRRSIHISSFLPRNGRSLIDDWGPDTETRRAERDQIHADGMLWKSPPGEALGGEVDLTDSQRRWLSEHFVPHPGRTILDPARMTHGVTSQPITFVSSAASDADPRVDLPLEFANGTPERWTLRTMNGGHWPMLTDPAALVTHLVEAANG